MNVYDLSGRRVRALMDEQLRPSDYRMVWDGRDDYGMRVAAGVYLVRLQTRDKVDTQRVILIR